MKGIFTTVDTMAVTIDRWMIIAAVHQKEWFPLTSNAIHITFEVKIIIDMNCFRTIVGSFDRVIVRTFNIIATCFEFTLRNTNVDGIKRFTVFSYLNSSNLLRSGGSRDIPSINHQLGWKGNKDKTREVDEFHAADGD